MSWNVIMSPTMALLELADLKICRSAKYCGGVLLFTVTLKLQLVLWPQLLVAVTNTIVVPMGKVLPLGGLAKTEGGGLQPPLALTLKKTVAPFELVAVVVMFEEQLREIGGFVCEFTVTRNEQLVTPPQMSLAVQVTVVVPIGKVLPQIGRAHV